MATAKTSYVPTAAEASVADLLLRLGDGDPTAWEEIVSRYGELVYATVRTFRLQGADTRDATQTTWLHLSDGRAPRVTDPLLGAAVTEPTVEEIRDLGTHHAGS
jgi:hypothetical protein